MTGRFKATSSVRQVLSSLLRSYTHDRLTEILDQLGLHQGEGSKAQRVKAALENLSNEKLCDVAESYLRVHYDWQLEETVFLEREKIEGGCISQITRRQITRCFDDLDQGLSGELPLIDFLDADWPLRGGLEEIEEAFGFQSSGIKAEIERHVIRNDDWSVEQLLEELGAIGGSSKRFQRMIQRTLHPEARNGPEVQKLIESIRLLLERDNYTIEESGVISGYPIFEIIRKTNPKVGGRPKNIIFAAVGPKPEIGFADAINNDIILLSNASNCLVYDRPIPAKGLLWEDLIEWWKAENPAEADADLRKSLGKRLRDSLQSEGERNFFNNYFRSMRSLFGASLPALIPQVYLHYDPATAKSLLERRQGKRLPRQRMDFLLLLSNHRRVVIEIDGKQHFATDDGLASLEKYAEMVSADRQLSLSGYELYRFGANEVCGAGSQSKISGFLTKLLKA